MVRAVLKVLFLLLYGTSALMLYGQGKSELYLFNLVKSQDGQYHVFGPKYLSGFNPGGYTNQPYFTPSGDLLVSVRKAGENQNDIWLLSPVLKKSRQITKTSSNEYSPQVEPGGDYYSVVRQVEGSPIDQQVYQFPLQGGQYESLTPDVQDIGFYGWLNPGALGLYRIEGESNRLVSYNIQDHKTRKITSPIGRTLIGDGHGSIYYINKFSGTYWYIKRFSESSTVIDVIAETPSKSEDFAMTSDGTFFMGKDHVLMYFVPGEQPIWKTCGDLSVYGIKHISRMAISPDGRQLALVATEE